ncbi:MAG: hypothetical protein ACRDQD_08235 [Nocardioidaceae bacterium]
MVCIALDAAVMYRFTRVNTCCAPVAGAEAQVVTDALSALEFSANTEDVGREPTRNTGGNVCIPGNQREELQNYTVSLTFCNVIPDLASMVTGRSPVRDWEGNNAGWRWGVGRTDEGGFAMEIWFSEVGTGPCDPQAEGRWLYMVVPCLTKASPGDFSAADGDAVTFPMNATTKDGANWCRGPYNVMAQDGINTAGPLIDPLETGDHVYSVLTTIAPPEPTCEAGALVFADLGCESPGSPGSP